MPVRLFRSLNSFLTDTSIFKAQFCDLIFVKDISTINDTWCSLTILLNAIKIPNIYYPTNWVTYELV